MKKLFALLSLLLLSACATPARHTLFIDSSVSADVYTGDVKIGTTPFWGEMSGNDVMHLTLRKAGYKTAEIKVGYGVKDGYSRGGVFASTNTLSSDCNTNTSSFGNEEPQGVCQITAMYSIGSLFYGLGLSISVTDTFFPNPVLFEFNDNEFYVEMVPENKNKFTQKDLENLRFKAFVLKNFPQLQAQKQEYLAALRRLAPTESGVDGYVSAAEYLRAVR